MKLGQTRSDRSRASSQCVAHHRIRFAGRLQLEQTPIILGAPLFILAWHLTIDEDSDFDRNTALEVKEVPPLPFPQS
jgi:hypothetical protein